MEEQALDFSTRKREDLISPQPSSSRSVSPQFNQMFHQQDYIPLSNDLPRTVVHHSSATSVKSEDEISEILDLSVPPTADNQLLHLVSTQQGTFYEQMLHRIESCFSGIREELNHRNQIESQRIAMEIAKFKYLHPYFSYDL